MTNSSSVTFQLTSAPNLSVIRVTVKYTPSHSVGEGVGGAVPKVTDAKAGLAERSMALTVISRVSSPIPEYVSPLLNLAIRVDSPISRPLGRLCTRTWSPPSSVPLLMPVLRLKLTYQSSGVPRIRAITVSPS